MPAEKAVALVVRGTDWSETSRITTLFTREFGRVRALAKGGRRLKSSFDVAFDLLSVCRIVFLRKSSEGLDLLTEARLEERFPALRANLPALYTGYYVAELLADGTQDYDPHPTLFDAAIETLRGLGDADGTALTAATRFELVWLRELGYSPRLDACVSCSARVGIDGSGRVAYGPSAGGVLCPACGAGVSDRRWLSLAAFDELKRFAGESDPDDRHRPHESGDRSRPHGVSTELRQVLGQSVSFVLGRRPRLLGYVDTR